MSAMTTLCILCAVLHEHYIALIVDYKGTDSVPLFVTANQTQPHQKTK